MSSPEAGYEFLRYVDRRSIARDTVTKDYPALWVWWFDSHIVPELLDLARRRLGAEVIFHERESEATWLPWEPSEARWRRAYYEIRFGEEWPPGDLERIASSMEAEGLGLPFDQTFRLYPKSPIEGEAALETYIAWVPIEWRWREALSQLRLFPGSMEYRVRGGDKEVDELRHRLANKALHQSDRSRIAGKQGDPDVDPWEWEWFAEFDPIGRIRFSPITRGRLGAHEFTITAVADQRIQPASLSAHREEGPVAPFDTSRLRGKFTPGVKGVLMKTEPPYLEVAIAALGLASLTALTALTAGAIWLAGWRKR